MKALRDERRIASISANADVLEQAIHGLATLYLTTTAVLVALL